MLVSIHFETMKFYLIILLVFSLIEIINYAECRAVATQKKSSKKGKLVEILL